MDSDRRSNVSSFYGSRDRRSSFDPNTALSPNAPSPIPEQRQRVDSTTSSAFFSPDRFSQNSGDRLTGDMGVAGPRGAVGSAGYNRTSFFAPGREEPVKGGRDEVQPLNPRGDLSPTAQGEGWDVYADFNNSGPRYSAALMANEAGYRQIPPGASKPETPSALESEGRVELVTVPALGSEWKASELRDMTKSGRREARTEALAAKWRAFRRDESGFCGIRWLTRRAFVFFLFGLCVVVGITLAFTIPRVPSFSFNVDTPLSGSQNAAFSRTPANFSFDADLNLQIDTHSNFLPLHFKNVHAQVFDIDTNAKIAEGDLGSKTLPAKAFNTVLLPVQFKYAAVNDTDQTWMDVYFACRNKQNVPAGQNRPPLKLRIVLDLSISGLPSHPIAGTAIDGAPCPFELPTNSV